MPAGRKKAAAGKKPHGRKKTPRVKGTWMSRSQIAIRASIDRETVSKYLAQPGAPKPNAKHLYEYKTAVAWIRTVAPKLNASSEEMKSINLAMARMRREDFEIDLNVKRKLYVEKKVIEPTIVAVMTLLTEHLRTKFELELPTKYPGKTPAECQVVNAAAIDWVLANFKTGLVGIR